MKYTVSYTVDRITLTGPLARVALEVDRREPWAGAALSAAYAGIHAAGGTVYNVKGEAVAGALSDVLGS